MPFHFEMQDLALIGLLAFLEGILSVDNALVLAMMVKPLPPGQRKKALSYGLLGAGVFRLAALALASFLMQANWVKFVGGGYLLFIALKHLVQGEHTHDPSIPRKPTSFWKTVFMIELMDIAFAVDSILAAIALTDKLWIVFTGGMIGVIMMRFAASGFVKLIQRFPGFEKTAYVLVLEIGLKIILEGLHLPGLDFESPSHPTFWIFWGIVAATIGASFILPKKKNSP
jgi:YkoY family integral membrane protein